ncbi:MAG: hypothetical protein ACI935_000082 [Moritella dasanensis]|jgi:hypothetical protein|nr:hypothetical protein [Moritella viscosa]SHO06880.1 DNA-directed RNA polymerase subunit alpha-RNA polymerase subunit alpha-Transcriptase subunit alpha [Moritella viscosa]
MTLAEQVLGAKPQRRNIDGAPFAIHNIVLVVGVQDDMPEEHIGRKGKVLYYEYDGGCGQSYPKEPLIGVRFFDNNDLEEFWSEELTKEIL